MGAPSQPCACSLCLQRRLWWVKCPAVFGSACGLEDEKQGHLCGQVVLSTLLPLPCKSWGLGELPGWPLVAIQSLPRAHRSPHTGDNWTPHLPLVANPHHAWILSSEAVHQQPFTVMNRDWTKLLSWVLWVLLAHDFTWELFNTALQKQKSNDGQGFHFSSYPKQ